MEFRVMTFNIHHGKGTDGKVNLQRIGDIIRASDVDIVGLNEVDKHFSKRSDYIDQAAWLAEYLQMSYVFSPSHSLPSRSAKRDSIPNREYGNSLLSRYPILSYHTHLFSLPIKRMEGRSILEAQVKIQEQSLKVFSTHLSLHPSSHRKQTDYLLQKITEEKEPTVVLGDWNRRPRSKIWKRITSHLHDAWERKHEALGYTFPSYHPILRLDYIFVSKNISIVDTEVVKIMPYASDHLPVKATLKI